MVWNMGKLVWCSLDANQGWNNLVSYIHRIGPIVIRIFRPKMMTKRKYTKEEVEEFLMEELLNRIESQIEDEEIYAAS